MNLPAITKIVAAKLDANRTEVIRDLGWVARLAEAMLWPILAPHLSAAVQVAVETTAAELAKPTADEVSAVVGDVEARMGVKFEPEPPTVDLPAPVKPVVTGPVATGG